MRQKDHIRYPQGKTRLEPLGVVVFACIMSGKYSKWRRSNVAVIIVRIVFIDSFLFYCLLFNHSFSTNSKSLTNCLTTLFSLFTTYNYIAPAFAILMSVSMMSLVQTSIETTIRTLQITNTSLIPKLIFEPIGK